MAQLDSNTSLSGQKKIEPFKVEFKPYEPGSSGTYSPIATLGKPIAFQAGGYKAKGELINPQDTGVKTEVFSNKERRDKPFTLSDKAHYGYFPADLGGGEYIVDPTTPAGDSLKTVRQNERDLSIEEQIIRKKIRGGLSSDTVQIDHIIPLWLGGTDRLLNLEPLLQGEYHEKKNKVDAVIRTLFYNNDTKTGEKMIGPKQAMVEMVNWRDKDVDGIVPDEKGNIADIIDPKTGAIIKRGADIAKEIYEKWKNPPQPGYLDVAKAIAYHMPVVGNIINKITGGPNKTTQALLDSWHEGPKSAIGAGVASLASSASFGWNPMPTGTPENQSLARDVAVTAGGVGGTLVSYLLTAGLVEKALGLKAAGKATEIASNAEALGKMSTLSFMAKDYGSALGLAKAASGLSAEATAVANSVAKSFSLGAMSMKFLQGPTGQFLTSTTPLISGLSPVMTKYMPNVTGKIIGEMLTQAGMFTLMEAMWQKDEYNLGEEFKKLIEAGAKGAVFGSIGGKGALRYPAANTAAFTSIYAIDKLSGMSTRDAIADATMMMALHNTFVGMSKLKLPGKLSDIPARLHLLDTSIANKLDQSMETTRLRLTDKFGEQLVGKQPADVSAAKIKEFTEKAQKKLEETGDTIAFEKDLSDIQNYYQWLYVKSMSPYEQRQKGIDDMNSLIQYIAKPDDGSGRVIPDYLQKWITDNPRWTNGDWTGLEATVNPTKAKKITGPMQLTDTATNLENIERVIAPDAMVGDQSSVVLLKRLDQIERLTKVNIQRRAAGLPEYDVEGYIQGVGFDRITGEPVHLGKVPTEARLGKLEYDNNGKIIGPDRTPGVYDKTSINAQIEIQNKARAAAGKQQFDYIDPNKSSSEAINTYLKDNEGVGVLANLVVAERAGATSNKPYVIIDITSDHAQRVIPKSSVDMTDLSVTSSAIAKQANTAATTNAITALVEKLPEADPAKVLLENLTAAVSGADGRAASALRKKLGYDKTKDAYKVGNIYVNPKEFTLDNAMNNMWEKTPHDAKGFFETIFQASDINGVPRALMAETRLYRSPQLEAPAMEARTGEATLPTAPKTNKDDGKILSEKIKDITKILVRGEDGKTNIDVTVGGMVSDRFSKADKTKTTVAKEKKKVVHEIITKTPKAIKGETPELKNSAEEEAYAEMVLKKAARFKREMAIKEKSMELRNGPVKFLKRKWKGEENPVPLRIISGGQTGADQGGLRGAKEAGLETGGTAPKGFWTDKGADPSLSKYGMKEHESSSYRERTIQNVKDSDGTVIFGNTQSPGSLLTISTAKKNNIPILLNPSAKELRSFADGKNVINIAGNRESTNKGIEKKVAEIIKQAFGSGEAKMRLTKEEAIKRGEPLKKETYIPKERTPQEEATYQQMLEDYKGGVKPLERVYNKDMSAFYYKNNPDVWLKTKKEVSDISKKPKEVDSRLYESPELYDKTVADKHWASVAEENRIQDLTDFARDTQRSEKLPKMLEDNARIWETEDYRVKQELIEEFNKDWGWDWNDVGLTNSGRYMNATELSSARNIDGMVLEQQLLRSAKESEGPIAVFWQSVIDLFNKRKPGWNKAGSKLDKEGLESLFSEQTTKAGFKKGEEGSTYDRKNDPEVRRIAVELLLSNVNPERLKNVPPELVRTFKSIQRENKNAFVETFPSTKAKSGRYVNMFNDIATFVREGKDVAQKQGEARFDDLHIKTGKGKTNKETEGTKKEGTADTSVEDLKRNTVKTSLDLTETEIANSVSWVLSPFDLIGAKNMTKEEIELVAKKFVDVTSGAWRISEKNKTVGLADGAGMMDSIGKIEAKRNELKTGSTGILDLILESNKGISTYKDTPYDIAEKAITDVALRMHFPEMERINNRKLILRKAEEDARTALDPDMPPESYALKPKVKKPYNQEYNFYFKEAKQDGVPLSDVVKEMPSGKSFEATQEKINNIKLPEEYLRGAKEWETENPGLPVEIDQALGKLKSVDLLPSANPLSKELDFMFHFDKGTVNLSNEGLIQHNISKADDYLDVDLYYYLLNKIESRKTAPAVEPIMEAVAPAVVKKAEPIPRPIAPPGGKADVENELAWRRLEEVLAQNKK